MAWPTYTADVTQNSNTVTIYGAVPAADIPLGDEVIVYGATVVANLEVAGGTALMYDGSGNPYSYLYLARPYTGTSANGVEIVIKPTGSLTRDVVDVFRNGTNQTNQALANYYQFCEGTTPITHQPLDENAPPLTIKTLPMMEQEVQAFYDAAGTAYAYDVTASPTDTANGANGQPKLMKVGDGGVLSSALYDGNIDNITVNGTYYLTNTTTGTKPSVVSSFDGYILEAVEWADDSIQKQNISRYGKTFTRQKSGGTWLPWVEILHTGNMVGTVTSDKTGSIIERGSNVNGEYVKFADGTLICNIARSITYTAGVQQVFTLPATFITTTNVGISASVGAESAFDYQHVVQIASQASYAFLSNVSASLNTLRVTVVGRWM